MRGQRRPPVGEAPSESASATDSNGRSSRPDHSSEWSSWINALTRTTDVHLVQARLYELRSREGSWHAAAERLGALLDDLGRRWASGAISVIEEHLASATLQRALAAVVDAMPVSPQAPRCLLAAAEGDEHTLGLSLVDLCLREAGWRSEWAGIRTRGSDITERVSRGGLEMVALSAASSTDSQATLEAEVAAVGAACQAHGIVLVLGGSGAWPSPPPYGQRFRSLAAFYTFARSYVRARTP